MNDEAEYYGDRDIKLSTIIKEKHGKELEALTKIIKCVSNGLMWENEDVTYKELMEIILNRLEKKQFNSILHLIHYIDEDDSNHIDIARHWVISKVIFNGGYNSNVTEYVNSHVEYICDNIMSGNAKFIAGVLERIY